jgi:protein tyrosine/serine phosphatase
MVGALGIGGVSSESFAAGGKSPNHDNSPFVKEFGKITKNVYRSGRPEGDALFNLKKAYGIKTIINLEDDAKAVAAERAVAKSLKMNYINIPFNAWKNPKTADVNQVLEHMTDRDLFPVLVHCTAGQDRTGMIVGLYRVLVQGWDARTAYKEMKAFNFHDMFHPLLNYFKTRTGL